MFLSSVSLFFYRFEFESRTHEKIEFVFKLTYFELKFDFTLSLTQSDLSSKFELKSDLSSKFELKSRFELNFNVTSLTHGVMSSTH